MNEQQINNLSKEIFEFNKSVGWWDDMDRPIFQTLQLVSTEIAEATEGARKNLMDDHLPHRKMEEVELADALIRILDFGGRYDLSFSENPNHSYFSCLDEDISEFSCIAEAHFYLNILLVEFGRSVARAIDYNKFIVGENMHSSTMDYYSVLILAILKISEKYHYDLFGALLEKFEYNKTRADHKRENREKEHGKKF